MDLFLRHLESYQINLIGNKIGKIPISFSCGWNRRGISWSEKSRDIVSLMHQKIRLCLKGQCHEIVGHFFLNQKTPPGPHMNRQKRFREIFRFCKDIREKRVSA